MHIGLVTDSLAELSLEALVETAQTLGIRALESGCGNWSSAPHLMSSDPLAAIPALGSAIYHVHAKDTRIDRGIGARNGLLDVTPEPGCRKPLLALCHARQRPRWLVVATILYGARSIC